MALVAALLWWLLWWGFGLLLVWLWVRIWLWWGVRVGIFVVCSGLGACCLGCSDLGFVGFGVWICAGW